jgi:hypothetical protein
MEVYMIWKLPLFNAIVIFILIACGGQTEHKSDHKDQHVKETSDVKTYYYTCPMESHKHIAGTKSGDCSECGMKLVAAVESTSDDAEYYGCPMANHSHIRHKETGKCEECNMDLKAMRLDVK